MLFTSDVQLAPGRSQIDKNRLFSFRPCQSADVLSERHFVRTSLDVLSGQPLRFCQQKLAKIRKNEQKDQKKQKEAKMSKMDKEEQEGACPEIKNLKGGPDKSSFCQMSKPVRLKKMSHKTGLTKRLSDKTSKGGFQKLLSGFFPLRGEGHPHSAKLLWAQ